MWSPKSVNSTTPTFLKVTKVKGFYIYISNMFFFSLFT